MIRLYPYPVCAYCGAPVRTEKRTGPVTCGSHSDLPQVDPHFQQVDQWADAR